VKVTSGPGSWVGGPAEGVADGDGVVVSDPEGDAGVEPVGRWSPVTRSSSLWTTYPTPTATKVTKTAAVSVASTPGVIFTAERYRGERAAQTGLCEL
jgi:hypothetical protein